MATVEWEFCRDIRPTGDGVSLQNQQWVDVTDPEMVTDMGGDSFEFEGQVWYLHTRDPYHMMVYQSITVAENQLLVRPKCRHWIVLDMYASKMPTSTRVRFQARYKMTNNIATDFEICGLEGISFYDVQWYVLETLKPPEGTGIKILSTAHEIRIMTLFDCMVYVEGAAAAGYKPKYRLHKKTKPGESRLSEFFLPVMG
ncbi:unnamed protein product [Symbiodinium sp. CCMP2592]|nr:unnamed protein product [Symbiodinium sp. CCMP2592]CAE7488931.1 unnamed protein product [Symbiodinium sp. CCMP2592]